MLYMCIGYHIWVNMYHVSAQGVDERMINVHYYYYYYYYYYSAGHQQQQTTPLCQYEVLQIIIELIDYLKELTAWKPQMLK